MIQKIIKPIKYFILSLLPAFGVATADQTVLKPIRNVSLPEGVFAPEDISGIAQYGYLLALGSDEAVGEKGRSNYLQLLVSPKQDVYKLHSHHLLLEGSKEEGEELDIEGIAAEGKYLYVVGSHSSKRPRLKAKYSHEKNHKRLTAAAIKDERGRDWLFRVKLNKAGDEADIERVSLRDVIKNNPVLAPFADLPSKENGVDIEGVAAEKGQVYIGFRGPVLRDNYVPIMQFSFDKPEDYQMRFVQLGGRGIRDMTRVRDGFLLIAGAVGDADMSYQLYFWDGVDMVESKDHKAGKLVLLGEIETPKGGKAEGITVVNEGAYYDALIAFDGIQDLQQIVQRFRVPVLD